MTARVNLNRLGYTGSRTEICSLVAPTARRVLDCGCSTGDTGVKIISTIPNVQMFGLEINNAYGQIAREYYNEIIICDLDNVEVSDLPNDIDTLILADVLKHTRNPEQNLKKLLKACTADVNVIISVPNIQHYTAIFNLIRGYWPETERGLFDKTHLRWFTERKIRHLISNCSLQIISMDRRFRIIDTPNKKINSYARFLNIRGIRNYFTYQYVLACRQLESFEK